MCTVVGRVGELKQGLWRSPEDSEWILDIGQWNFVITQDIRDARVVGNLPRRAANGEWNQTKRKKYGSLIKAE